MLLCAATVLSQENYAQWSFYKTIKLNTTASGANVATAQLDFPVLVRLTAADSAVFSGSRRLGSDLRFTKANGVRLKHELEHWDSAARSAAVWVKLDTVKGNDSTLFRMYWGKIGAPDSSRGASVFDTAAGYRAVWHLNETAGPSRDATIHASNALWMAPDTTKLLSVPGRAGRALNFSNGTGTTVDNASFLQSNYNPANKNFKVSSSRGLTLSAWVNRPATAFSILGVIGIAGRFTYTGGAFRQFALSANNGATYQLQARASEDGLDGTTEFSINQAGNANNTWYHATMTLVNGSQILYRNGVQVGTPTARNLPALDSAWADAPFAIAKLDATTTGNAQFWNGIIDEVRLFHGVRTPDWIKLEYQNQQATDSLLSVGAAVTAQQTGAPANFTYAPGNATYTTTLAITPNVASVTGVVDSFTISPALPNGLVMSKSTGVISGTPTAASAATSYTVTARNASGTATAQVNLTVVPLPPPSAFSYKINPLIGTVGQIIPQDTAVVTGRVDSFTVSPALPPVLTLNKTTGIIIGTPVVASSAANYTVTAHNPAGTATVQLTITVNPPAAVAPARAAWSRVDMVRSGRTVRFRLPGGNEPVQLSILDLRGATVWSRNVPADGRIREVAWNGLARGGSPASAGTYTVRITGEGRGSAAAFETRLIYAP
jgi:hypothetical protein